MVSFWKKINYYGFKNMKNLNLILLIIIGGCMKNIKIPEAEKQPYKMTVHGDTRIDDYYWMRLSKEPFFLQCILYSFSDS